MLRSHLLIQLTIRPNGFDQLVSLNVRLRMWKKVCQLKALLLMLDFYWLGTSQTRLLNVSA